ncbi:MAG: MASE1 domain-containing protein, partial [Proteobacteria bacterium]|nr:MASE1 domain-containing protein [Pseudomonadota bacterium]
MLQKNILAEPTELSSQGFSFPVPALLAFVATIFATQILGMAFYFSAENVSTFWPSSGLVIAALLLTKLRCWPVIMATLISIQVALEMTIYERSFAYAMAFLLPICTETLLAAGTIRLLLKTSLHIWDNWHFSYFVIVAVFGATLVGSLVGATVVKSFFPIVSYWQVWQVWWFADALGVLITAPPILAWFEYQKDRPDRYRRIKERRIEIGIWGLGLIGAAIVLFSAEVGGRTSIIEYPYVVIPFLVWAAVRFDQRIVATGLLITSCVLVGMTVTGVGPFIVIGLSSKETVLALQAFFSVTVLTVIILSNQVELKNKNEEALRESEGRFKDIANASADWFWEMGPDLRFTYLSERFFEITGFRPEKKIDAPRTRYDDPTDQEA